MKNTFKLAAIAVAALGLTVACKNAPAEEIDSTPIDTVLIEESIPEEVAEVAEEVQEEEPVKTTVKKDNTKKLIEL